MNVVISQRAQLYQWIESLSPMKEYLVDDLLPKPATQSTAPVNSRTWTLKVPHCPLSVIIKNVLHFISCLVIIIVVLELISFLLSFQNNISIFHIGFFKFKISANMYFQLYFNWWKLFVLVLVNTNSPPPPFFLISLTHVCIMLFSGALLYKKLKEYAMTEEQLQEHGYPRPHPEMSGHAVVHNLPEKKNNDRKVYFHGLRPISCC